MNKELINLKNKLNALGETKEASYLGGFVKEANDGADAFIEEILKPLSDDGYLKLKDISSEDDFSMVNNTAAYSKMKMLYDQDAGTGYLNLYLSTNDSGAWDPDAEVLYSPDTIYSAGEDSLHKYYLVYDNDFLSDDDLYVVLYDLDKEKAGELIQNSNSGIPEKKANAEIQIQHIMDVVNQITDQNYTMGEAPDESEEQAVEEQRPPQQRERSTQTLSSPSAGAPPPVRTQSPSGSDVAAPPFSGESRSRPRQAPAQTRSQPSSPPAISGCSKTERNNLSLVDVASRGGYFQKCQESPHIKQIQDLLKFFGENINDKPGLFGEDTKASIQKLTGKSGEIIGEDELVEIAIRAAQQGRGKLLTHVIAPSNWEQIVKDQRFRDLYKERGQKGRQFRRLIRKNLRNNGIYGIRRFRAWLRKNKTEDDTGSQFGDDSF